MVLRVRTFEHIHQLSIAEQSEEKRGVFVARVTADVDALQQFMEWAGIAWLISFAQVLGALVLMLVYSWQLTLAVVLLVIPLLLVVGSMQSKLTTAYNTARTRVGEMLSEVSESVMGAAVVRAYGLEEQTDRKVKHAIDERYRAEVRDALPGRHALADVVDLLRGRALRGDRAGRHLRALVGPHVRAGHRVPVPGRHLPARVHRPARGLRGDADRDRRLAQDPGGPRPAGRDRRALARGGAAERRALRRGAGRALRVPHGRRGAARHLARGPGGRRTWRSWARPGAARPPS